MGTGPITSRLIIQCTSTVPQSQAMTKAIISRHMIVCLIVVFDIMTADLPACSG